MKKTYFILFGFIIVVYLITGCSKDDTVLTMSSSSNSSTQQSALAATPSSLSIKPNLLSYSPGNTITFTGKVTDIFGAGVYGVQVGVDDPVKQFCSLCPKTNLFGSFTYTSTIPSTCKGIYGFAFYLGGLKYYVAVNIKSTTGLTATNSNHKIPIGISSSASTFNSSSVIKVPTTSGFSSATYSQLSQTAGIVADYSLSILGNTLADYVSNPVTDVLSVVSIACLVSSPTVITQTACSAVYVYVTKAVAKSFAVGVATTLINKSAMSSTDKTYWLNQIAVGKCVVGMIDLDPSSVASTASTGWTCGSVTYKAFSSPRKSLELVGTPTATSTNNDEIGVILINK